MFPKALRTVSVLALLLASTASSAVELSLERKSSAPGKARVCVSLDSQGEEVAGTQNDINFDNGCASLKADNCVASKHHGKPLHGSVPANLPSTFRALVFALDNVDPMADGEVYCCDFTVEEDGDSCCPAELSGLGVSDPQGVSLDVSANPGRVCLAGDAGAAPAAAMDKPAAASPAAEPGIPSWLWVVLLAAVVMAVLFFALRKAG